MGRFLHRFFMAATAIFFLGHGISVDAATYAANTQQAYRFDIDRNSLLPLPPDLQHLKTMDVYHMKSPYQLGPSCGWYSMFNAQAISHCLHQQKKINYNELSILVTSSYLARVKKYEKEFQAMVHANKILHGMYSHEKYAVGKKLGIDNVCVVEVWNNKMYHVTGSYSFSYHSLTFQSLKKMLMNNSTGHVQILLTVPAQKHFAHAVLLTFIKSTQGKSILMYMDSNNELLSRDTTCDGYEYPRHVREFIKSLDAA